MIALYNRLYITTGWRFPLVSVDWKTANQKKDCEDRLREGRWPSGPRLRRPLKRKELAGSPDDSRLQTQLVLTRNQLYNRWCK